MRKKFQELVRLFRPELPFAAGVTVLVGEMVALGSLPTLSQATLGFTCVFILSLLPQVRGWMGIQYALAIIVADACLLYFTLKLLHSQNSKEGVFAMRGIYLGLTAGMIVYILGQLLF